MCGRSATYPCSNANIRPMGKWSIHILTAVLRDMFVRWVCFRCVYVCVCVGSAQMPLYGLCKRYAANGLVIRANSRRDCWQRPTCVRRCAKDESRINVCYCTVYYLDVVLAQRLSCSRSSKTWNIYTIRDAIWQHERPDCDDIEDDRPALSRGSSKLNVCRENY